MASQVCPKCGKLSEGKEDYPRDPCEDCWKLGWRSDACGNLYQVKVLRPVELQYCAECDAVAELDHNGRCFLCADSIKQQLREENDGLPG